MGDINWTRWSRFDELRDLTHTDSHAAAGAGCVAHALRKFHELWANHSSQIAGEALKLFGVLYDVERD